MSNRSSDEPTPVPDEAPDSLSEHASDICQRLQATEERILQEFERKLAYDRFKEQQISKLHDELQEYKRGLADSLMMPLVKQIIRYLDQLPRHIQALREKPAERLGPEQLFSELEGVREDLEMILENVGVTAFQNPEPDFDPRYQQARLTEQSDCAGQHGKILTRLLPGYEFNGRLVEKERVTVIVCRDPGTDATSAENEENS